MAIWHGAQKKPAMVYSRYIVQLSTGKVDKDCVAIEDRVLCNYVRNQVMCSTTLSVEDIRTSLVVTV